MIIEDSLKRKWFIDSNDKSVLEYKKPGRKAKRNREREARRKNRS